MARTQAEERLRSVAADDSTALGRANEVCSSRCLTWEQVQAMADWYHGVTTLLVVAGTGLRKLAERDGDPELHLAYRVLQDTVIRPVDQRASDEAEELENV